MRIQHRILARRSPVLLLLAAGALGCSDPVTAPEPVPTTRYGPSATRIANDSRVELAVTYRQAFLDGRQLWEVYSSARNTSPATLFYDDVTCSPSRVPMLYGRDAAGEEFAYLAYPYPLCPIGIFDRVAWSPGATAAVRSTVYLRPGERGSSPLQVVARMRYQEPEGTAHVLEVEVTLGD